MGISKIEEDVSYLLLEYTQSEDPIAHKKKLVEGKKPQVLFTIIKIINYKDLELGFLVGIHYMMELHLGVDVILF